VLINLFVEISLEFLKPRFFRGYEINSSETAVKDGSAAGTALFRKNKYCNSAKNVQKNFGKKFDHSLGRR
jgi:hypothetical protein